ncbi:MAG: nicotinate (nicotinamide) nucleotide adenylyltransferase [Acidobacteriota bacterium]
MQRLGILGGTFNPVHVGHVRLALEMQEALGLDRVELVPAARPPHKQDDPMPPFELRAELAELAVEGLSCVGVNRMEADRPGPSYTWDTLLELTANRPGVELNFIMGATDLVNLHSWKHGTKLGTLANLAVSTRDHLGGDEIAAYLANHPEMGYSPDGPGRWVQDGGRRIQLVDVPRLDISASFIRDRFRRGANLRFLVPLRVEEELNRRRDQLLALWG